MDYMRIPYSRSYPTRHIEENNNIEIKSEKIKGNGIKYLRILPENKFKIIKQKNIHISNKRIYGRNWKLK